MKKAATLLFAVLLTLSARADQFVSGQAADVVLGQTDFTSGSEASMPNRFKNPEAVAMDPTTGKVLIADSGNFRILRFSSAAAATSGASPEAVIGQPNFTSTIANQGGPAAGNTLAFVYQITVDAMGRLWVADFGNNRVLGYVGASFLSNNAAADYVFGQPNFTTTADAATQSKMDRPAGVAVGPDDTLWVADSGNSRVLRFASVSTKVSGANADGVLGQVNFTNESEGVGTTQMASPFSVAADAGGRLWVADTNNNRILRFENAATAADADGNPANGVLGQPDFVTGIPNLSASGMSAPYGVLAGDDGTVWVGDYSNARVLGFRNAATKGFPATADLVLGKPDFTSPAIGPTAAILGGPVNLSQGPNGSLFVADYNFNRVLRFSPVKSPTLTITTRPLTTRSAAITVRGTTTGQTSKVEAKVGNGGFKSANGTANWSFRATLKKGRNTITARATGPGGTSASKTVRIKRR